MLLVGKVNDISQGESSTALRAAVPRNVLWSPGEKWIGGGEELCGRSLDGKEVFGGEGQPCGSAPPCCVLVYCGI